METNLNKLSIINNSIITNNKKEIENFKDYKISYGKSDSYNIVKIINMTNSFHKISIIELHGGCICCSTWIKEIKLRIRTLSNESILKPNGGKTYNFKFNELIEYLKSIGKYDYKKDNFQHGGLDFKTENTYNLVLKLIYENFQLK